MNPLLKAVPGSIDWTAHTVTIPGVEFCKIPDNPRQRDTERHLARAKHLVEHDETHLRVSVAYCEASGQRWKLDGHTRALAWLRGALPMPAHVIASIYQVSDAAGAAELYSRFDNAAAVETAADRTFGAYREVAFAPKSPILRRAALATALQIAEACKLKTRSKAPSTEYDLVRLWISELYALDALAPDRRRFPNPFIAAALLTFRRDSADAFDFWRLYNSDAGRKTDDGRDGVEALTQFAANRENFTGSWRFDLVGKGIAAYEAFRDGRFLTGGLQGRDPLRFLR